MRKLVQSLLVLTLLLSLCACKSTKELKLHVINDIHYAPKDLYSYTGSFAMANDTSGTFKQIRYQEEIIDAFIANELIEKPDYLLINGDLTFSGDYKAHETFVNKFKTLIDNGIKVLVVPGNHDFDYAPYTLPSGTVVFSNQLTKEQFKDIYQDFGYSDGLSYDELTLSYSYKLSKDKLLIALDTIHEYGYTEGMIKTATLNWLKEQLQYAKDNKMQVVVMGHHNLYLHNPLFSNGYQLNNSDKVIQLLSEYNVHLYLTAHMHIQEIEKENDLEEIMTSSFMIYPHHYGEILINKNNDYSYVAKNVDVDSYYKDSDNNDLKDYTNYGYNFMFNNAYNQIISKYDNPELSADFLKMCELEARMNVAYFMGEKLELSKDELKDYEDYSSYIKSTLSYLQTADLYSNGSLK